MPTSPLTPSRRRHTPKHNLPSKSSELDKVKPEKLTEKQLNMLFRMNIEDFMKELRTRFTHAELVEICAKLHDTKKVKAFQEMNKLELVVDVTNMLYYAIDNTQNKYYKTACSIMYTVATLASAVGIPIASAVEIGSYLKTTEYPPKKANFIINMVRLVGEVVGLYLPDLVNTIITHIYKNIYKQRTKPIFRKILTKKRRP